MKKVVTILACVMLLAATGCQKKEEPKQEAPVAPAVEAPAADAAAPAADAAAPAADAAAPAADNVKPSASTVVASGDQTPEAIAAPANAVATASGLKYVKLKENAAGRSVSATDTVLVHYSGWTTDGKMFDSSVGRGEPAVFPVGNLIPGFIEALTLSKVGEAMRVWIPEELAYKGAPGAPAGMLIFDLEVVDNITPVMPPKEIPSEATKLAKGVAYRIVDAKADAKRITDKDVVTLNFTGWKQDDGRMFHSTRLEGSPLVAPAEAFFPGWKAILPNVREGETFQSWIPQSEGIAPDGGEGMDGMLIFEVKVEKVVPMPDAPADVASIPSDATKLESGVATKVIKSSSDTTRPTANSLVKVNYSGWTTDGKLFDSSIIHGDSAMLPLNQIPAGWSEGIQQMVVGETRRIWIPEELAFKGIPDAPAGMIVYEVELLEILGEMPSMAELPGLAMPDVDAEAEAVANEIANNLAEAVKAEAAPAGEAAAAGEAAPAGEAAAAPAN